MTNGINTDPNRSPVWTMVMGIIFLGLAVIFIMALIVANLFQFTVQDKFLVCALLALVTSIGSGFLGGSAVANGQISVPRLLENPVHFGITGGIAVFIIVLLVSSQLYKQPYPPPAKVPLITNVETSEGNNNKNIISIDFQQESFPAQNKLYVEIAKDKEFKQLVRPKFPIDDPKLGDAILSFEKSDSDTYWIRLIVETPDGQVKEGESMSFKIS